jgi:hypothetical protein
MADHDIQFKFPPSVFNFYRNKFMVCENFFKELNRDWFTITTLEYLYDKYKIEKKLNIPFYQVYLDVDFFFNIKIDEPKKYNPNMIILTRFLSDFYNINTGDFDWFVDFNTYIFPENIAYYRVQFVKYRYVKEFRKQQEYYDEEYCLKDAFTDEKVDALNYEYWFDRIAKNPDFRKKYENLMQRDEERKKRIEEYENDKNLLEDDFILDINLLKNIEGAAEDLKNNKENIQCNKIID